MGQKGSLLSYGTPPHVFVSEEENALTMVSRVTEWQLSLARKFLSRLEQISAFPAWGLQLMLKKLDLSLLC